MKITDFGISRFNASAREAVKDQTLNFCQAVSMSYENNVSVTARYCPELYGGKFVVLDPHRNPVPLDNLDLYYYGVSPAMDSNLIITAISGFRLADSAGLDSFISEYCGCFMLHGDQAQYLADYARHAVLTLAAKFGIRIAFSETLYDRLRQEDPAGEIVKKEDDYLLICGCPTREMQTVLGEYRYVHQYIQKKDVWKTAADGVPFETIYQDKKNIVLLSGRVFYSGVLFKPLKIESPEECFENYRMKNVSIVFERSTFAAVCSFDEVHLDHPLLKDGEDHLAALFRHDDRCKLALAEKLCAEVECSETFVWECVNEYLKTCDNVNQIGVSANIITRDDRLLMGIRRSKNIDEGCLYPGVNGNAEIKDDNVGFYTYSVFEDDPTIHLDSKRIDFLGEISREAYGEIRLDCNNKWVCYGLILSGQLPEEIPEETAYTQKRRRMHFNIIFEKKCDQTQAEIEASMEKASESFETSKFLGVRICCYKNAADWLLQSAMSLVRNVIAAKDIIESVALLVLLVAWSGNRADYAPGLLDMISYGFAALISVVALVNLIHCIGNRYVWDKRGFRKRYPGKTVRIFCRQSPEKLYGKINRAMNMPYHPAAYAAAKLCVENRVYDRISRKSEKEAD